MKRIRVESFPFLILFIIHTFFLLSAFIKKKNRKSLYILLLSNIGFAYLFEFFTLNLFRSYQYKPKFFGNRYLDNIFGAFLSQGIFLPFTSTFLSAFGHGWKIKAMFALYFSIIERIFIKLGIFKNNWWRTMYTIFFIQLYFKISDFWYKSMLKRKGVILFISLFMMNWVTGSSIFNMFSVLQKKRFGIGRFYNWKEHFILVSVYWFICSLFTTLSIRNYPNWQGKVQSFIFMKLFDWFLGKKGIVKNQLNNLLINNALQIIIIYLTSLYKDWIDHVNSISSSKKTI